MLAQASPCALQRSHWKLNVIGRVPVHVPWLAWSRLAFAAVPWMVGRAVLLGATVCACDSPATTAANAAPAVATAAATAISARYERWKRCLIPVFRMVARLLSQVVPRLVSRWRGRYTHMRRPNERLTRALTAQ